jgi:hypothetical protein
MANFAKTFVFATTSEGWSYTVGADETGTYLSGSGNPAGSLEIDLLGKRNVGTGYWEWTGTFEDLGVPADATITGYSSSALDYSAVVALGIDSFSSGPYTVNDGTLRTLVAAQTITGTTSFATLNQSGTITGLSLASTTSIALRITADMDTGNANDANLNLLLDNVKITVDYTAAAVPILTLPTEADITGTTATVGCTTDTAAGTLYWFVSETATPPTAANLKAGTGAYSSQFGSQLSPGIGTETFPVTSLTQGDDYYTYFLHTNATGDSIILESGVWYAQSVITADDLQSASQVSTPLSRGTNILLADDLQSASQVSTPLSRGTNILLAEDLQSASQVSTPVAVVVVPMLAEDLQSASQVSKPVLFEDTINELLAEDLQSASQVSKPVLFEDTINELLAEDLQSASQVSTPEAGQIHVLTADDLQSASQLSSPSAAENIEQLVPDADTSIGSWTTHTGSTSNLYQQIDELQFNDTDYIRSELDPATSAAKFALSDPATTINAVDVQRVKYRYGKDVSDSQQIDLTVRLIQGASTVIATWSHTNIPVTVTPANQVLTGPQKSSITNHNDLFIEFEANGL